MEIVWSILFGCDLLVLFYLLGLVGLFY